MGFLGDLFSGGKNGANFQATNQNIFDPGNQQLQNNVQNQNSFVQALQTQAAGGGPSAANATLNQAMQNNASQANAQAASQQGNVNVGLASRNAAMIGSQANQQAAGTAATMRNQEQLQAQGMLGNQLNTQMQQGLGAQQANQNANLQAQNINAGIAQGNQKSENNAIGGGLNALGGMFGLAHGGMAPKMDDGGLLTSHNIANDSSGGGSQGLAKLAMLALAAGGAVPNMDAGGALMSPHNAYLNDKDAPPGRFTTGTPTPSRPQASQAGPAGQPSTVSNSLSNLLANAAETQTFQDGKQTSGFGTEDTMHQSPEVMYATGGQVDGPKSFVTQFLTGKKMASGGQAIMKENYAKGGRTQVPVILSPGEGILPPGTPPKQAAKAVATKQAPMVPGKAKVKGDSKKNDVVPTKLAEGSLVIPRSIMNSPDASKKAAEFVSKVMSKKGSFPKR